MPKKNQKGGGDEGVKSKGKGKKGNAATAEADDDFDTILAKLRASDPPRSTITDKNTTTGSSTSSSSSSSGSSKSATGMEATEAMIVQASIRGNFTQLLRWAKRGVRVSSGEALCHAVSNNEIGAVRCLVTDLGADVNREDEDGYTPLAIAAQMGFLHMMRCLVAELGADVDRADKEGISPLHMQPKKETWKRCSAWSRNLELTST
jgi:biotin carboxyl carrier protein